MPSTAVYLVSPRIRALIAAILMLSGVSKSGSPAASPITSLPAAFISIALLEIAMVGEGFMRLSASARKAMTISAGPRHRGRPCGKGPQRQRQDSMPDDSHKAG